MESPDPTVWQPNEELLEMLTAMGISKIAAEHALYCTGNQSAEAAASYVFDNADNDIEFLPPLISAPQIPRHKSKGKSEHSAGDAASSDDDDDAESYKMAFIVNAALNMGVGKLASQVAHASLGLYRLLRSSNTVQGESLSNSLFEWENDGEKKVVLRGLDAEHLCDLRTAAQNIEGLYCYTVTDAGHTQVPSGSLTVLALFGRESVLDRVTGELSLL